MVAWLAPAAHAGERVTLRNGFAVECNHHAEADGKVKLFQGTDEANYMEVKADEISAYEWVPDPPVLHAEEPVKAPAEVKVSAEGDAKLSPENLSGDDLHEMLAKAGREHNLDVDLLASLVKAESNGNARAVSRAGARGLMQLMPKTAAELGVADSFAPEQNVRGGSAYLDELLAEYHDNLALALAAYNAGPAAVARYHGIPPYRETRAYLARVIHEFNRRVKARRKMAVETAMASR